MKCITSFQNLIYLYIFLFLNQISINNFLSYSLAKVRINIRTRATISTAQRNAMEITLQYMGRKDFC